MSKDKKETPITIKPVYQRNISIDENIHATLSIHALSLYIAFRLEADYRCEHSNIRRSAKFLYTKAKISRSQYYICLNELEHHGLVVRDENNALGETCYFHVAKELGFFNRGVSQIDTGVEQKDTDQDSFQSSSINTTTNSEFPSEITPTIVKKVNSKKPNLELMELINIYRKVFPENPQPHSRVISTSLQQTLRSLIKRWPELDPNGKPLTYEMFEKYLKTLREDAPNFSLKEYTTSSGNKRKNGLDTFARWNTVVKFMEQQYS